MATTHVRSLPGHRKYAELKRQDGMGDKPEFGYASVVIAVKESVFDSEREALR